MHTREIPRQEWLAFFNNFSTQHHGWTVKVEIFSDEIGAQVEAKTMPLNGIAVDLKGNGSDSILITVGDTFDEHITHSIPAPIHVRLESADSGVNEALQIVSAHETTTLIRLA